MLKGQRSEQRLRLHSTVYNQVDSRLVCPVKKNTIKKLETIECGSHAVDEGRAYSGRWHLSTELSLKALNQLVWHRRRELTTPLRQSADLMYQCQLMATSCQSQSESESIKIFLPPPPRRLCFCRFFVCLSVCQQDNSKSYGRIFLKFWGYVGNGTNYQWFNFGGDPAGILDSGPLWNFCVLKGA